ncbi:MAG TPA: NosD domain-containing protein [Lysobacter sp.]
MHPRLTLATLMLATLTLAPSPPVRAAKAYDNCTGFIDTLPATIATAGTWCLRKDLGTAMASGNAITIATNNVTLDCNDFKLGGLAAGPGTNANGIYANDRLNATVRHCKVRGFRTGIRLEGDGDGHVVEDNRLDSNTWIGIQVNGDGSVVRRNEVRDTIGTATYSIGIYVFDNVDVLDNLVDLVVSIPADTDGQAYGIYLVSSNGGRIAGNNVRRLLSKSGGTVTAIKTATSWAHVRDNTLTGNLGSANVSRGVWCDDDGNGSGVYKVIVQDNSFLGFIDEAFLNCVNGGGNSVASQ